MDFLDSGRIWTKSFMAVCMSSFFMLLNFYLLATVLPLYVQETMNGTQQQMGLVITCWSIGVVLLRIFAGTWTDRYGEKRVTLLALSVFLLASILYFGASGSILLLLLVRAIHGGSYGAASTSASALAANLVPDSRKGEGIGYFGMFMSIAMVIGPAFGIFLWNRFENGTILLSVSAAISVFALGSAMLVKPGKNAVRAGRKAKLTWRSLIEKKALPVSLAGFMLSFAYSSLVSFITVYTKEQGQEEASVFFIVFAILIILSRPFIGRVFDRYGGHVLVYPGILLFAAGMFMLSQEKTAPMLLFSGAVLGLGYGALFPSFQTIAIQSVSRERGGIATSTFFLLFDLGYGVGSFVLGLIAGAADYRVMYIVAGMAGLLSGVVYYLFHHRRQPLHSFP